MSAPQITESVYKKIQAYAAKLAWRKSAEFIDDVVQDTCELILRWPPEELNNRLLYVTCQRAFFALLRQLYNSIEDLGAAYEDACEQLVDTSCAPDAAVYERELERRLHEGSSNLYELAYKASVDFFFRGFSNQDLEEKYGGRSAMQMVYQAKNQLKKMLFGNSFCART